MFQTFARKPTASPSAMSTSGDALMASSPRPLRLLIGATKNEWKARSGFFPSAENRMTPVATVSPAATSGESHFIRADGASRGSSVSRNSDLRGGGSALGALPLGAGPHAGHPHADLLDVRIARRPRRREPALGEHRDAIADLEQLVELFGDHEDRSAGVAELDELLADESRRTDVDAPGRLRRHQHARPLQELAADDELL